MNLGAIEKWALEAGLRDWASDAALERFAAFVIANHPQQSYMSWQEGYAAGVASEREACARVCEDAPEPDGADLAERIRARGQA